MQSKLQAKTFGKREAIELVARLVAHWPNMAAEQGSEKVLVREYELQFVGYDPAIVDAAATHVIGSMKFPPKVAELKEAVRAEFVARVGRPERSSWRDDEPDHYRPNTPDEVARRDRQIKEWRAQYGLDVQASKVDAPEKPWREFTQAEIESARALREMCKEG